MGAFVENEVQSHTEPMVGSGQLCFLRALYIGNIYKSGDFLGRL